jgi:hypothetical protein
MVCSDPRLLGKIVDTSDKAAVWKLSDGMVVLAAARMLGLVVDSSDRTIDWKLSECTGVCAEP